MCKSYDFRKTVKCHNMSHQSSTTMSFLEQISKKVLFYKEWSVSSVKVLQTIKNWKLRLKENCLLIVATNYSFSFIITMNDLQQTTTTSINNKNGMIMMGKWLNIVTAPCYLLQYNNTKILIMLISFASFYWKLSVWNTTINNKQKIII